MPKHSFHRNAYAPGELYVIKRMKRYGVIYGLIPIMAIGLIKPLHAQADDERLPRNGHNEALVGSWTGSWMSATFLLEFKDNDEAFLTAISAQVIRDASFEPIFSRGIYAVVDMEEPSIELELITSGERFSLPCFLKGQNRLDCVFEGEEVIRFTRNDDSDFDWELWGTYYYLNPQPEKFAQAAKAMARSGVLDQKRHMIADLRMLMAAIMAQNPDRIHEWMSAVDRNTHKVFWDDALYYSRTAQGTDILLGEGKKKGRRFARFIKRGAPIPYEMEPEAADILDLNWGYFFATGDTRAVRNIIRAFNYAEHEPFIDKWEMSRKTKQDSKNYNLGTAYRAARWSIHANCTTHSRVLRFCHDLAQAGNLPPAEAMTLRSILDEADVETARKLYDAR